VNEMGKLEFFDSRPGFCRSSMLISVVVLIPNWAFCLLYNNLKKKNGFVMPAFV